MKTYFNIRTNQGVETVDELSRVDFATNAEFRAEKSRLKKEYHIAGMNIYTSQRCTNNWKA